MKFKIIETSEEKELVMRDVNGTDWTVDLIGNSGDTNIRYDSDSGLYMTDKDTFEWWSNYIADATADSEELAGLDAKYGKESVENILNEEHEGVNDYNDHHAANQRAFDRVREELKPIAG